MAEEHDGDWNIQNAAHDAEEHNHPEGGAEGLGEAQSEQPTVSLQPLGLNPEETVDFARSSDGQNGQGQESAQGSSVYGDNAGESDTSNTPGDGAINVDGDNADAGSDGSKNSEDPNGSNGADQTATSEPVPATTSFAAQETAPIPTAGLGVEQPTMPLYRPAPEYGAYGPVPGQTQNGDGSAAASDAQQTGQPGGQPNGGQPGATQPGTQPGDQGNRNPYFGSNPFFNPGGQRPNDQSGNASQGTPRPYGAGNQPQSPQGPQRSQTPGYPPQGSFAGNQTPAGAAPNRPANAIVVAVVAALVAAALCLGVGYAAITNGWVSVPSASSMSEVGSSQASAGSAPLKAGKAADWTAVAGSVSGSVVSIQVQLANGSAKGSGAIFDTSGHIVTNNHVISGAQQIQVTLANGQMYTAKVVGTDATTDLAVIKLDNPPSDLKPVQFADSDSLAVGQGVMAIGNPLGYDDTATTGIVSALNRPVSVLDDSGKAQIVTNAVQIDAAINPGNSGGPTFDAAGNVIGVNSSIASTATSGSQAGSIGIGFAIPSNLVKRVAQEIIDNGSVKHVQLGVTIGDATAQADGVTRGGSKIAKVVSGSPADKAGLKVGDTVVAFNDNAVNNTYSLLGFVRASALGSKVKLTVVRDSKAIDVEVTLDQQESTSASTQSGSGSQNGNGSNGGSGNGSGNDGSGNGSGNGNGDSGNGGGFNDPFGLW
ncbi:trypsin-like peptidase domain-containing protein [Bifidobacterium tibiigranuli]|jgi:putative serine protease PepD|uniref:trypsin-like peptidase domain-containing protein n=1 Tax=Bifidobacterium tibiigranuli TaxID=2172043 RepID=UPI0026EA7885|nr:trypsin-like peptidase domain-containing protein [Bifidobacterium tibiigranuli]MCI1649036.1 trypsin-like peptidase domain-containing protein [Bifidobacterium tibiigranuli]MCI1673203.1 trypsin-like peptidase domain-containing protein [Bifidobacterium tibiigranuli]MCI1713552.1 trypsin-like peptidase domain-containing protein [Bifidobacterium tibiigranuli]MCI1833900.1 trypsin-like peptidase domain-containing protein [Bifidobacterium tibiigranuli]MCI2186271.1 trypsin-like peptidase domain-conta